MAKLTETHFHCAPKGDNKGDLWAAARHISASETAGDGMRVGSPWLQKALLPCGFWQGGCALLLGHCKEQPTSSPQHQPQALKHQLLLPLVLLLFLLHFFLCASPSVPYSLARFSSFSPLPPAFLLSVSFSRSPPSFCRPPGSVSGQPGKPAEGNFLGRPPPRHQPSPARAVPPPLSPRHGAAPAAAPSAADLLLASPQGPGRPAHCSAPGPRGRGSGMDGESGLCERGMSEKQAP